MTKGNGRSVYLPTYIDDKLRSLAREKGLSRNELVKAAVAAKLTEWIRDDDDENMLRQDLLIARGNRGHCRPGKGETLRIPDAVIEDVRSRRAGDLSGAIGALVSWWNSVRPAHMPEATNFDIYGSKGEYGYSYTVDVPAHQPPEWYEGRPGTAKAAGLIVEFRFHRFSLDGMLEIINMDGVFIEGCKVGFDSYEFWMGTALDKAFSMEWGHEHT